MNITEHLCPVCQEGHLTNQVEKITKEYKGRTKSLDSFYSVCNSCGSEQANAAQVRDNKRVMVAFKKEVDGLLTGKQIKALRQHLSLTQIRAATLFGGGPVAFSKYENDDITQSESMDRLIRVCDAVPEAFSWISNESNNGNSFSVENHKYSYRKAIYTKFFATKENTIKQAKRTSRIIIEQTEVLDVQVGNSPSETVAA